MTPTQALAKVKKKFNLSSVTTFDTIITDCIETASLLLAPYVNKPLTVDTSVSLASTDTSFTLPVAGSTVRRIHLVLSDGHEVLWTDWTQHGDTILLTDNLPGSCTVHLYADGDYEAADTVDLRFAPAWIDWACSEFATTLAGDKTSYNTYSQTTGARSVDNMLDLAEFYEQRAERRIIRVADAEGLN